MICTPHLIHSGDQMKKQMGRACGTYGRQERCIHGGGELRERDNLQDLGVDGTVTIKWTGLIWLRRGACGRLLRKR